MAYELFYAFKTTSTVLELICALMWFLFDISFVLVAMLSAYPKQSRRGVTRRLVGLFIGGLTILRYLCLLYPDEREQKTAFWTGVILQLPISLGSVGHLLQHGSTMGHSLEIW